MWGAFFNSQASLGKMNHAKKKIKGRNAEAEFSLLEVRSNLGDRGRRTSSLKQQRELKKNSA